VVQPPADSLPYICRRPTAAYSASIGERSIVMCVPVSACVCLSVRDHVFGTTGPILTKFSVLVTCGCGSVLLWQRNDMLRISGFMDDVIFALKLRLLDVAARLGSKAYTGFTRRNIRYRQRTLGTT